MVFRFLFRRFLAFYSSANSFYGRYDQSSPRGRKSRKNPCNRRILLETLEDRFNPAPIGQIPILANWSYQDQPKSIIFIDSNLTNSIPAAELAGSQVVSLNPNQDFFSQVSNKLNGIHDLEVVRLITHGQSGAVVLGNQVIDDAALKSHSSLVQGWSRAMAPGADFLVYGCNVGATPSGASLLNDLSKLTGTDVAGSNDASGAGGDLNFEVKIGNVGAGFLSNQSEWERSGVTLLTISSANNTTTTYGSSGNFNVTVTGDLGTVTYSLTGSPPVGVSIDSGTGIISITGAVNAGTYNFTVQADDTGSPTDTQSFTITVDKAFLTVTADDKSKIYGGADPSLTFTPSGTLYNGDAYSVITGVSLSTTTGASATVGTHSITISGATASNYTVSLVNGALTVSAATLTITANNLSGVYGTLSPSSLNGVTGFTPAGLHYGETVGSVTLTTNATISTSGNYNYHATPWTITPSAATGGSFTPSNYAITYVNGQLSVSKRALTITATGVDRQYDGTTNATVVLSDNRVGGDVFSDTYNSAVFTTNKHVGTNKPISVTGISISGTDSGNYSYNTTASTTANITKKIISAVDISSYSTSQTYGDPADLNPIYSGPYNQAGSVYFDNKVDIASFNTSFQFQTKTLTHSAGDGITFVIQNTGLNAVGANGEGLGYQGIGNSVAVKIDLVNNYGEGTNSLGVYTGGANPSIPAIPSTSLSPYGLFFETNHIFQIDLSYNGSVLSVSVADLTARLIHTQSYSIDIPTAVGDTLNHKAYIGFTGGTGALASQQSILNWSLTDATNTKVVDYSTGFNDTIHLAFNGAALARGNPLNPTYPSYPLNPTNPAPIANQLVLTCSNKAFDFATGIFSESLPILLSSTGNSAGADVGSYAIDGHYYDGSGLASDYDIQNFTNGTLTVNKKSITKTIEDQRQTYDSPSKLNTAINSDRSVNYLNEAGSVFFDTPVSVNSAFTTTFTFQSKTLTSVGADGFAFVLQNKGLGAVGQSGEGLGYQGIQKSVAIKFDRFNNQGEGTGSTGIFYGGANPSTFVGSNDLTGSGIDFSSNHDFYASISYNGSGTLTVYLNDIQTNANATQTYSVNLSSKVFGNSAYIGFTAGTGSQASEQSIKSWSLIGSSNFNYTDFNNPAPLIINGSAACNFSSKSLVLTGNNPGKFIETGVNDEHLKLTLSTAGTNVGTYTLTGVAADDDLQGNYSKTGAKNTAGNSGKLSNYNLTLNNGNIQIRPADLIITAPTQTINYGTNTLSLPTFSGLKNGETVGSVTYDVNSGKSSAGFYRASSLDANNAFAPIPWEIAPSNATGGTFTPSNYNITYFKGLLTVNRANLTINAINQVKNYGDSFAFIGNEFTSSGLLSGDLINYVEFSTAATQSNCDFGTYPINASQARGSDMENYNVTYNTVPGVFTVNKKSLTVNIANKSQSVGTKAELNDIYPNNYSQQVGSFFTSSKVDVSTFSTSFKFKFSKVDSNVGEGFTFTIQNNNASKVGGKYEGLGYSGIDHSLAVKFDLTDNEGEGSSSTGVYINGAKPTILGSDAVKKDNLGHGIDLQDMDDCKADIDYDGTNIHLKITDLVSGEFFSKTYSGYDIPALCGNKMAYVGFTGCTGTTVKQEIKSWTLTPASGSPISFGSGFGTNAEPPGLTINGDSVANWSTGFITLTDQNYGQQILGANNETLFVFLTSTGNTSGTPAGTYVLTYDGKIYSGTGKLSNYTITINNGSLIVS